MKAILLFSALLFYNLTGNSQCSYYVKVATGNNGTHTLGIKNDGTLWAWGNNSNGQLGDGTTTQRINPIQIGVATNWVTIAAGSQHSLGITADGKLWTWGNNSSGQLGDGSTTQRNTPTHVGNSNNWVAIAGGGLHSVGRTSDGKLWTWGNNGKGQLGDGTTNQRKNPTQITNSTNWQSVSAGEYHTMAKSSDGKLWAWGDNANGQLGDGTFVQKQTPKQVGSNTNWVSFEAGGAHSVGKTLDNKIWAWGDNSFGQLGDGTSITKNSPLQVGIASNWSTITAGQYHSAAITKNGNLYTWGYNFYGQLGDNSNVQQNIPTQIVANQIWKNIIIGGYHSLATTADGKVWTWGYNAFGQLGNGTNSNLSVPVAITTGPLTYFSLQPIDKSDCQGAKIVFNSTALGINPITYQWKKNGVNIGNNKDSLVLNNIVFADSGIYNIVATGLCNAVSSDSVFLNVLKKISITSQPIAQTINSGANVGFSISATGGIINYQWRKNGTAITGATNASIVLNNTNMVDSGNYDVVIFGYCDTIVSSSVKLKVLDNQCAFFTIVASGPNSAHSLGIKNDGTLWAWGINTSGQLGDPTVGQTNIPIQVGVATNWAAISLGESHSIGLTTDGKLWAWGWNGYGQLGDGTNSNLNVPTQIGIATNWTKIAAGGYHTLAIATDGKLWAWGQNSVGQLGDGTTTQRTSPKQIGNNTNWITIAAGETHSLARTSDGKLWAWGFNGVGQLGDGSTTQRTSPVQIGNATNWTSISAGTYHSLGRTSDGKLWAWGYNFYGQLGDGSTTQRKNPTQVGTGTNWTSVSGGYRHTVAMTNDGNLWAWGYNFYGQLGEGTNTQQNNPVLVASSLKWSSCTAGQNHTLGITNDGKLRAWGRNSEGQLGDSTYINKNIPVIVTAGTPTVFNTNPLAMTVCEGTSNLLFVEVSGTGSFNYQWKRNGVNVGTNSDTLFLSNIATIDSGYYKVIVSGSCNNVSSDSALLTVKLLPDILTQPIAQAYNKGANVSFSVVASGSGLLYQWKKNGVNISSATSAILNLNNIDYSDSGDYTVLITGDCDQTISDPAKLTVLNNQCAHFSIISNSAASNHSFGIKNDGTLWAWGNNSSGQLGDGSTSQKTIPVQIGTMNTWVNIATGQNHTIGLTSDGKLYAWGKNTDGQLGDGTNNDQTIPIQIGANNTWVKIAAGQNHSLVITLEGKLYAFGKNNNGQLGNGTTISSNSPIQIGNASNWSDIACGNSHSMAISADGKMWSWGNNSNGQLGDGTTTNKNNPAQIGAATNWMNISCGNNHSVAKNASNNIYAWGNNSNGQLGDGTTTQKNVPTQVGNAINWSQIFAGSNHNIALTDDGKIYTWGNNSNGQIGDGTTTQRTSPTQIGASLVWLSIAIGSDYSFGKTNDGKSWAWGENNNGQLGDGTTTQRNNPVSISNAPFLTFAVQPVLTYSCPGANTLFKSTVIGIGAKNYVWYKNGNIIGGANTDSLGINNTNIADTGIYKVKVSGTCGTIMSNNVSLLLNQATSISTQPVTRYTCLGGNTNFNVITKGSGILTYNWFKNGISTGVVTDSFKVNNILLSDTGNYYVEVKGTCGTINSDIVKLEMTSITTIVNQPSPSDNCAGSHIGITVKTSGNGTINYQWYKNGVKIGNNLDTLIIYGLIASDTGYYKVNVSGNCNNVMSDSVKISIKNLISITEQPKAQIVCPGVIANFEVKSSDPAVSNYQWYKDGIMVGTNSSILTITNAKNTDLGNYKVKLIGFCNNVFSDSQSLKLNSFASIKEAPVGKDICIGENTKFEVIIEGTGTIDYNWKKGDINLGVNSSTIVVNNATISEAGYYKVVVTTACNVLESDSVKLNVNKCATNIKEINTAKLSSVHPNPFNSNLQINFEAKSNQISHLYLHDVNGRIVFSSDLQTMVGKNEHQIFPSSLISGAYFLFVEVDGEKLQFKLLKEE